jgi:hypothetical protein
MGKKIKLTETELTRLIEKVIGEQIDDKDVILERLLVEAQRLMRFIADSRSGKGAWSNEDLSSIQENINTDITNYLK